MNCVQTLKDGYKGHGAAGQVDSGSGDGDGTLTLTPGADGVGAGNGKGGLTGSECAPQCEGCVFGTCVAPGVCKCTDAAAGPNCTFCSVRVFHHGFCCNFEGMAVVVGRAIY